MQRSRFEVKEEVVGSGKGRFGLSTIHPQVEIKSSQHDAFKTRQSQRARVPQNAGVVGEVQWE